MAASTEVIKMQFQGQTEIGPTAYFACLQDMMTNYITSQSKGQQSAMNIEALSYSYSAIISTLDFGVISN